MKRRENNRYVNQEWMRDHLKGKYALIVGSGPSIKGFDFDKWRRPDVCFMVVNHPVKLIKPDIFCVLENNVVVHLKTLHWDFEAGTGGGWSGFRTLFGPNVALRSAGMATAYIDTIDGRKLYTSTGAWAVGLAAKMNAKGVFLIGHDGPGKEIHAYGDREFRGGLVQEPPAKYEAMLNAYLHLKSLPIPIYNLNPDAKVWFSNTTPEAGLKVLDNENGRR